LVQASPKSCEELYNSAICDSYAVRRDPPLAERKWG